MSLQKLSLMKRLCIWKLKSGEHLCSDFIAATAVFHLKLLAILGTINSYQPRPGGFKHVMSLFFHPEKLEENSHVDPFFSLGG